MNDLSGDKNDHLGWEKISVKFHLIVQLLQQVLENTELTRGSGLQNAFIFMPARNVCILE